MIYWLILLCKVCAADFAGGGVVGGGVDLVVGRGESEEMEGRGEDMKMGKKGRGGEEGAR